MIIGINYIVHYQPDLFSMLKGSKFMLTYVRKTNSMYMLHMLINKMVHVSPVCDLDKTGYTSHVWLKCVINIITYGAAAYSFFFFFETVPFPCFRLFFKKGQTEVLCG